MSRERDEVPPMETALVFKTSFGRENGTNRHCHRNGADQANQNQDKSDHRNKGFKANTSSIAQPD